MYKKSKAKMIVALVLTVCFVLTYFIMFFHVNNLYPQNKRMVYKVGNSFVAQNAEFTVKSAEFLERADIDKNSDLVETLKNSSDYLSEQELNLAIVEMIVKNPTNEKITLDLTAFHLESGAFSLQFYYPLMQYYNECGMYVELDGSEEKIIKAPIPITGNHFLNYDINNIKNRDYYIVCSLYTEKIMAEVKFNKA